MYFIQYERNLHKNHKPKIISIQILLLVEQCEVERPRRLHPFERFKTPLTAFLNPLSRVKKILIIVDGGFLIHMAVWLKKAKITSRCFSRNHYLGRSWDWGF